MAEKPKSLLEGGSTNALGNALGEAFKRYGGGCHQCVTSKGGPIDSKESLSS